MSSQDVASSWRRRVYALLIVVAGFAVAGRILAVSRVYEPYLYRAPDDPEDPRGAWPAIRPKPMPTLGANDRSRWATIRALVETGSYAIGTRDPARISATNKYGDGGIIADEGWDTIDKVMPPGTNTFYSSKPPFLSTFLAGEYWLLKHALGWSITDPGGQVIRTILLTVNLLPFVVYLALLAMLIDGLGTTDWGRLFVVTAACFATFLTPFAVSLNNHTPAAVSAGIALCLFCGIWSMAAGAETALPVGKPAGVVTSAPWSFALTGSLAGFTACMELPAAAFVALMFVLLLWRMPGPTLRYFLPPVLLLAGAFLVTNYLAIGELLPAYSKVDGPWYRYEGSYWQTLADMSQPGIDGAGRLESRAAYAWNLLLGHHGLFSLTPVFLLSLAGIALQLRHLRDVGALPVATLLAAMTLMLTVTVVGFYVVKTSNYGGWTSGPRWLMWLTPLLLLVMVPAADLLAARRWSRVVGYLLLGMSVLSVSYPAWNPWRHPWLYDLLKGFGQVPY
jgi:hypothetical protein